MNYTFNKTFKVWLKASLIIGLLITSCSKKEDKLNETSIEKKLFLSSEVTNEYKKLATREKYNFIIDLLKGRFKNKNDEKEWLAKNLPTILQDTTNLNSSNLTELNHLLLKKDCVNEAVPYATKLLAKNTRIPKATKSSTASILVAYYNSTKQADSLGKYVDILERNIQEKGDELWLYMSLYSNKGNLANLKGEFFDAAINYQKAIDYAKPSDTKNLSVLYHSLASMYLNLDYIEKAKEYTDLTLELINPDDIPLYYYNTQGIIQGKAKNFKEAEKTFQTIIEKSKQGSHQMLLAQSYSNYGNLKRKKKEFEAGLKYLSLSDSICKKLKVDVGIFYNKINRAELYFDSKKLDKALSEINPLKDFVVDADNPKLKMSVYELLYRIYDDLSQTDLANTYYRLYTENKNMYIGDLPRSVVSEWEVAREREKKLQLSVAYESKLQKQNSNKYWLSTGFLLFVLLSVMAYFIIYKKQLKQKQLYQQERQELQYQVQLKSKELLSTTIKELSIQRVKDDLLSDLNKILDDLPNVHKNKFNLLKQKLIAITSNELFLDFESKLDISFSTFYNKLKDVAPNLSPSELIVCD
ncbi:tetratricopeptide repeat protein [Psychroflexus maritimus]|uniref:Tetratricopeptide repeat-containing protein n=1 Tax=Psychroflexus maritimus TaxID=2714865 RepID=A0A967AFA5_9FLAO|nr:hypothetical protein [Psychroflexus maritimus]NGZ90178.1 hypothetical protein [Psychroflexus maritimus]